MNLSAQNRRDRLGLALVRDVDQVDTGAQLQQLGSKMRYCSVHCREVEQAGMCFGVADQLGHRLRREVRGDDEDLKSIRDLRDGTKILCWIITRVLCRHRN